MRPIDLFIIYARGRNYSVTLDPSGMFFADPKTQEAFEAWTNGYMTMLNMNPMQRQNMMATAAMMQPLPPMPVKTP